MAIKDRREESWQIKLIAKSEDCTGRYRKWKPPRDGWFCRETNKGCAIHKCPRKTG